MYETIVQLIARMRGDPSLASRISPDTLLLDEIGLDSMEVVELMLGLEDALDVEIPFGAMDRADLSSVRALVRAIEEKTA